MKILQILVLILGIAVFANAQVNERKTTLKGRIFNQVGGVISDSWITLVDLNGKSLTFQPYSQGNYRRQISPGTYSILVKYKKSQLYESYQIEKYEIPLTDYEITLDMTLRTSKKFRDEFGDLENKTESPISKIEKQ